MNSSNQQTRRVAAPVILALLIIGVWFLIGPLAGTPSALIPSPVDVAKRLGSDLVNAQIWPYVGATVAASLFGCLLGAIIAIPLAVGIYRSTWFSAAVEPFLGATQAIPAIALAPLLVLWVGYGLFPIVLLCALMVFFPVLISTLTGLTLVPRDLVEAARLDGANQWELLWLIEWPLCLPSILGGVKNGFAISVTGAVVGEMVMGGQGLGMVLTVQRDATDTTGMFSTILILCLFASGAYLLITLWERNSRTVTTLTNR